MLTKRQINSSYDRAATVFESAAEQLHSSLHELPGWRKHLSEVEVLGAELAQCLASKKLAAAVKQLRQLDEAAERFLEDCGRLLVDLAALADDVRASRDEDDVDALVAKYQAIQEAAAAASADGPWELSERMEMDSLQDMFGDIDGKAGRFVSLVEEFYMPEDYGHLDTDFWDNDDVIEESIVGEE